MLVFFSIMDLKYYLFQGHLDEGEKILDVAHRHLFILFKSSFKTFFFGVALPCLLYLFFPQALLIAFAWLVGGLIGMIYHIIDWYFDAWLITNFGVIDIDRNGLFDRSATRIEYHMIEGTSYTITGFWATVLNFGDIVIDKLGTKTSVILNDATAPKKVERKVTRFQEKYVNDRSFRDHQALKDMLADMIAYHIQNEKIEFKNPGKGK